jgi:hypothetical protein
MPKNGTWVSYGGGGAIMLAAVLAAIAVAIGYAGLRLRRPARFPQARRPARIAALAGWLLGFVALPVCVHVYVLHAIRENVAVAPPADPITPFTLIGTGAIFCVIAMVYNARGWRTALWSAVIAAIAAPVIFEFPFDLIVMTRIYPGLPPDPALYRALFFAPLILIEISTLALLISSPAARLTRPALWSLAAMFAVFAGWALAGFGYPSAPVPTVLNVVSKILALVVALTLFVPAETEPDAVAPGAAARAAKPASASAWTGVI